MTNQELIDLLESEPADQELRFQGSVSSVFHTIEGKRTNTTNTGTYTVLQGAVETSAISGAVTGKDNPGADR